MSVCSGDVQAQKGAAAPDRVRRLFAVAGLLDTGIQRVKNDKADSAIIAEYAWRQQDKVVPFEPLNESIHNDA